MSSEIIWILSRYIMSSLETLSVTHMSSKMGAKSQWASLSAIAKKKQRKLRPTKEFLAGKNSFAVYVLENICQGIAQHLDKYTIYKAQSQARTFTYLVDHLQCCKSLDRYSDCKRNCFLLENTGKHC